MQFVWFWTFWHWSKESHRAGLLLRSPLHGIGSHWDEWFRHEASKVDHQAIEQAGATEASQRRFVGWLLRYWAREAGFRDNRPARQFVLGQLAHVQPFSQWTALAQYRAGYGVSGVAAIVLTESSTGEPEDVRPIEALVLPADPTAPSVISEGFQTDSIELETPRRAARSLLHGKGLLRFIALWLGGGRRPYPRWLAVLLGLSWLTVAGLMFSLFAGPDPRERLVPFTAALLTLWIVLVLVAVGVNGWQAFGAWRLGRTLAAHIERSQFRLRMRGGLTLKGGSAGLPFCLNMLYSLYCSRSHSAPGSWLWRQLFHRLRSEASQWAATGVLTADGQLRPVVIEPKLRACLRKDGIRHLLTPQQPGAGARAIDRTELPFSQPRPGAVPVTAAVSGARLGFAAERTFLRVHLCRHLAQAAMLIGNLSCTRQRGMNVIAAAVSCLMLFALPDLRGIVLPPPAPVAVAPSSQSPYYLWVSLDTEHPDSFQVVLESDYWSNRRADVRRYSGANASVRAEIPLRRLAQGTTRDEEEGTVWVERRRRFLGRDFAPGERVARYSFAHLNRLAHE